MELSIEAMKASFNNKGQFGDIFHGLQVEMLDSPIERSRLCPGYIASSDPGIEATYSDGSSVVAFIKMLLKLDHEHPLVKLRNLTAFEIDNLKKIDTFREICSALKEKHYRDAYHLWASEIHGLDYFLTTDKKFVNAVMLSSKIHEKLKCIPITPKELIEKLEVELIEPLPLEESEYYDFMTHEKIMLSAYQD